jgi:hypothetical protein
VTRLLTSLGEIQYHKTYFYNRETGEYCYLLDESRPFLSSILTGLLATAAIGAGFYRKHRYPCRYREYSNRIEFVKIV